MKRAWLAVAAAAWSVPTQAQLTAPVKNGETTITVTGTKRRDSKVEMSNWRMAETPHVVVFSKGPEKDLVRTAHNLEKLHFLLSALTGLVDQPDDTIKIALTMMGDAGDFEQLRLTDSRWQYGPFAAPFSKTIYYDPREEGPVLAATQSGFNVILQPSAGKPSDRDCPPNGEKPLNSTHAGTLQEFLDQMPLGEIAFCQSADSRLYAGFAQNYLMTYFPAAYPRWYVQGFGEMFATLDARDDFVEYGHVPEGLWEVLRRYGHYPVKDVLSGKYLSGRGQSWTPQHAWRLVHLLSFSEEWKPKLQSYLKAMASGEDQNIAARALGDPAALQKALFAYRGRKLQFERMTFPAERAPAATVRRLTRAEAGLIRGRLELGARIELPAEGATGRAAAIARREAWLNRLRGNAARFPDLIENQLLLAEAECRSGNAAQCLQSAERALAMSPTESAALVWKGSALAQLAVRGPAAERRARLKQARAVIAQANRLDPDGVLPLITYYDSFAVAAQRAPDVAVEGLFKVVASSPAAPKSRLMLGKELVDRDLHREARRTRGPFDSPERAPSTALLRRAEKGGT